MRVLLLLLSVLVVVGNVATSASKNPGFSSRPAPWVNYNVPSEFANPKGLARPAFRYWVPDADVDDDVLYADLQ